jgi:SSS family solute:Na+ symporter
VSRRVEGFADFFVAGRNMGTPLLVCTLVSTYYGLDVLFGGSEVGYVDGVVGWFFYARPYYLAILVAVIFVAPRLRRLDVLSLPDVAAPYGRATQALVAVASFLYSLPLLALMGIGIVLDVLLGIPLALGVVLGALLSVAYTLMGGLLADAFTDTVQFTLMCVTLGVAAALVLDAGGGIEGLRAALPASYFEPMGTYPLPVLLVFSLGALSVLVEPAIYQRIIAARSGRALAAALGVGVVLWASFDWIVTLLGMAARAAGIEAEPRYALLTLVLEVLPTGLEGLFVAGVLATAMSTIDSYLLIAGGNLAYDLYRPFSGRALDDADLLRLTRIGIVVAAVAAVGLALLFGSVVSAWVFMATALVGTALVPVSAALLFRRPSRMAGLSSAAVGLATVAIGYALVRAFGVEDSEWGTRIWTVAVGGHVFEVWQEYVVLAALPLSAGAFLAAELTDRLRRSGARP